MKLSSFAMPVVLAITAVALGCPEDGTTTCVVRGGATPCDVVLAVDGEIHTPAAALARARELKASGAVKGRLVEIGVKPGRYQLTEPLVLTAADSSIRFRGVCARTTVFDGGRELKPFTVGADGVWVTDVPEGLEFDQLWVGDHRAQRARSPNRFYHYMKDSDVELATRAFFADEADLAPLVNLPQDELNRVLVAVWQSWDMGYGRVESVDAQTGRLVMKQGMKRPLFFWCATRPRYALENFRAALDAPGEWFHDIKAKKLFYIPLAGESVTKDFAYVPVSTAIVKFVGDRAKGEVVRNISFDGIGFEHTAFLIGPQGVYNSQAASNVQEGAVAGTDVEDVSFENCRIAHTGAHGLYLRNGCRRVTVRHSLVEDLGAGGIYFGGDNRSRQKTLDGISSHLTVEDSIIRHGGRVLQAGIGVWMGHAHDCRVVHNEICDFFYTGVSLGWTWGYAPTVNRDNLIAHNRIHHIGQGALSDMGGVYTLGDNTGSVVRNNWIWEVNGYADNGSPAWGLYTDEGSHGFVFCDNLVEKCRDGAIHQHYGKENIYSNNLCLTFSKDGVWRSRSEDHVTIRVMNNVFWWTEPEAGTYRGGGSFEATRENLPADNNLYWCTAGKVKETAFKGESWEKWRALGHDVHGVIADPLFVDPAKGDWTLRPDSPALKLGFKPFDWHDTGVYRTNAVWRALSEEECWDRFEDAPKAPKYRREHLRADFERLRVGTVAHSMGGFAPLDANAGRAGQLKIVDVDPAQGKKALQFIDAPDLKPSWAPIVTAACSVDEGVVTISFALKIEAGAKPTIELRDYPKGQPLVNGVRLSVVKDRLQAGGKDVCAVQPGVWHDIVLTLPMSGPEMGRWSVAVTPRGGQTSRMQFEKFLDARFRELKWIGFISYGATTSVWFLDDVKLDTKR